MKAYVFRQQGRDEWSQPVEQKDLDRALRLRIKPGLWRIRGREQPWGPVRRRKPTIGRVKERLRNSDPGEFLAVKAMMRNAEYLIRTVETVPPAPNLPGATDGVEKIVGFLRAEFPNHQNLGWFNCRQIAGSSDFSQHAWGNAYDAGASSVSQVVAMADAVVAEAKAGRLPVAEAIANRRKWTPSTGWQPYGGSDPHTGHTHISGAPMRTGRPACA